MRRPCVSTERLYSHVLAWKGAVASRQAEETRILEPPRMRPGRRNLDRWTQAARVDAAAALRREVQDAGMIQASLASLARESPATVDQRADWLKRFDALEAEKERLEMQIAQVSSMSKNPPDPLRMLNHLTLSLDVRRALRPGSARFALVDFLAYSHFSPPPGGKGSFQKEERLLAFVLLADDKKSSLVHLGPTKAVDEAVQAWRQAVVEYKTPDEAAAVLARLVWQPLQGDLAGEQNVWIIPDGSLCGLPFAALPGRKPGTYLIEEMAIGYLASGQHLLEMASPEGDSSRGFGPRPFLLWSNSPNDPRWERSSMLAVGDILYGSSPDRSASTNNLPTHLRKPVWKALPGTRLEVEQVSQAFRAFFTPPEYRYKEAPVRLLIGDDASVARLKRELTSAADARLDAALSVRVYTDRADRMKDRGWLGEGASMERLKRELTAAADTPRWRCLHLATHAYFEAPVPNARQASGDAEGLKTSAREYRTYYRNPLLSSGLVLAGANRFPNEGILTAEEISYLNLSFVELVVLSACETGLGRVDSGEGVLGLQRAFQVAGARTLVTSLWNVNDAATSVLMEEFYANLWRKKLSKLESLRQAQLTVLRDPERVTRRARELRETLAKRGVPEELLAQRGLGKEAINLPIGRSTDNAASRPSLPALWAAFVLSGDPR